MKKCPYCAEEIQDEAIKCKYCGEWLDIIPPSQQGAFVKPPKKEQINEGSVDWQKKLQKIWDKHWAFIGTMLIIMLAVGIINMFGLGEKNDIDWSNPNSGKSSDDIDFSKLPDPTELYLGKETYTSSSPSILKRISSVTSLIPFRYESEQVGNRLIRYDRFTSRVEWKSVFSKDNKWRPLKFETLQQAKAVFQRRAIEDAQEEIADKMRQQHEESMDQMKDQQDELDRLNRELEWKR